MSQSEHTAVAMSPTHADSFSAAASPATAEAAAAGLDQDEVEMLEASRRRGMAGWVTRRRMIAVIAAVLVIAAAVAVTTYYLVTPKRGGIQVPKTFSAQYTLQPKADATSMGYTGHVYKTEAADGSWQWQIVAEEDLVNRPDATSKNVYTVINRRAFVQTFDLATGNLVSAGCLDSVYQLPLQDLMPLLQEAAVVPDAEFNQDAIGPCAGSTQSKFVLQWGTPTPKARNSYVYCQSADGTHHLVGEQFIASLFSISLTPADSEIVASPVGTDGKTLDCPELSVPSVLDNTASSSSRLLAAAAANAWWAAATPMRRLSGAKVCVFVHGSGYGSDQSIATSFSAYWGNVHTKIGGSCETYKFLRRNMNTVPYDTPALLTHFCNAAGSGTPKVIPATTVVFSHGTGSLLVAAAIDNGVCSFAANAKWYSVGAPFALSPVASAASSICASDYNSLSTYFTAEGACTASGNTYTASAAMTAIASVSASQVSTYKTKATGYMCGVNSYGLNGAYGNIVDYVNFGQGLVVHDGFVKASSCETAAYSSLSQSNFNSGKYYPIVSHIDLTCRHGDANIDLTGSASPCAWYDKMVN